MRYYYRIEKITHRPTEEDKITIITEVMDLDLKLARILATRNYFEEIQNLKGKYSPDCFQSYNTKKGLGFNYHLLFIDSDEEMELMVESTMKFLGKTLIAHREKEKGVFEKLDFEFPDLL